MNIHSGYSLRQRLLLRVLGTLLIVVTVGAIATFLLAQHIGSVVYDRWLYDSAMTLAHQIKIKDGKPFLDLSQTAVEMFEWDSVDHIFEEVTSQKSGLVFSNATFSRIPDRLEIGHPKYYDTQVNGKPARVVAVRINGASGNDDSLVIQVGETKHKRHSLIADILLYTIPEQVIIILLASSLAWLAITSSIRALDDTARRLEGYEVDSLVPVSDIDHAPNEVRPLLNSINQLIAKLSLAQQTQRRFIANAAHQLRTPLAALQVQTERALREPDQDRHSEALSHVLTAITRSRHLVHQLLTLARSEQFGDQFLDRVDVDLTQLARDEVERWTNAAIARGIDLGYEGPDHAVILSNAEPHLLHEMIGNLIDNAIRYGHQDGFITLGLTENPIALTLDDDGPGIPLEERALVKERFYRRPGAVGDGCGLGLAIAREIAIRHQASLNIKDTPTGKGVRFEVVFVKTAGQGVQGAETDA